MRYNSINNFTTKNKPHNTKIVNDGSFVPNPTHSQSVSLTQVEVRTTDGV